MTDTSQNGYPVLTSRTTGQLPRLRHWVIPGTGIALIARDGAAGFLLAHLALYFHERIEPIGAGRLDDWGWAARAVRGSTDVSNHASGTAIDLNATKHPLGKVGTLLRAARLRTWLRVRYAGAIRWGGDYNGRKDEMHFELVKPFDVVERLARRLTKSPRGKKILAANPGALDVINS